MKKKKRIGLLGGFSHESTAAYYTALHRKYYDRYGDYYFPEAVVFSLDFQHFTDLENGPDRGAYISYSRSGIDALVRAGVDCVAMTANSPHAVFEELAATCPVPMLSLIEATCDQAASRGLQDLLLLGIKFTMQSDFYQRVGSRLGLRVNVPPVDDQDHIDGIIFGELSHGLVREESRAAIASIIEHHPCDAVILGCTELPLLLQPGDVAVPLLDTIDIHTDSILEFALSDE